MQSGLLWAVVSPVSGFIELVCRNYEENFTLMK